MVGWVETETAASEFFEDVPRAQIVRRFDAATQSWRDADVLSPGMGLWIQLSEGAPVEWRRTRGEYVDGTPLVAGGNFVAWQALDDVPADVALREIRREVTVAMQWDGADQRFRMAAPAIGTSLWSLQQLNHGDAIWLRTSTATQWHQLTGEAPRIEFIGEVSQEDKAETLEFLQHARRLFAETFGGVMSGFPVYVYADRETNMAFQRATSGSGSERNSCGSAHQGSVHYTLGCGLDTLSHEYFHALQYVARDETINRGASGYGSELHWIREGGAYYAQFLPLEDAQPGIFARAISESWAWMRSHSQTLNAPSDSYQFIQYYGGAVAVELLLQHSRPSSLLQYPRLLSIYGSDSSGVRGYSHPERQAFEEAFGVNLDDFLQNFERVRQQAPTDARLPSQRATSMVTSEQPYRLDIELVGPDGRQVRQPLSVLLRQPGRGVSTQAYGAAIGGSMSSTAYPGHYQIEHIRAGNCSLKWDPLDGGGIPVTDTLVQQPTVVELRTLGCDGEITGLVVGPDGVPLGIRQLPVWVEVYKEDPGQSWLSNRVTQVSNDANGRFEIPLAAGRYSVGVAPIESDGAGYGWYSGNGRKLSLRYEDREILNVTGQGSIEIDLRMPFSQTTLLTGRVLSSANQPVAGVTVQPSWWWEREDTQADSRGWIGWGQRTIDDGSFSVQFKGANVGLEILRSGCLLGYYGPEGFTTDLEERSYWDTKDGDVEVGDIILPRTECE